MGVHDWGLYEQFAAELLRRNQVPGAAVGVAVDGETVYANGFGWANVENQVPIDENTVFGIGSVTKSFTAVAVMQLQEQGKLAVEDLVTKYLPEFRIGKQGAEQAMTIHHFLTHTAGVPPLPTLNHSMVRSYLADADEMEPEQVEKMKGITPIDTAEELLQFIADLDVQLLGNPGEHFSYSNDCWALLGAVIQRVSGMTYEDYVTKHILQPLGMQRSLFNGADLEHLENVTSLYASKKVAGEDQVYLSPNWSAAPAMTAAGFLKSTVHDMLRYMEIYRTGGVCAGTRILSERSVNLMTAPHAQAVPGQFYGYGLSVHGNYHGVSLVEHGGNVKGVSAYVTCVPERGVTGVALTNLSSAPGGSLLLGAVNNTLGLPVATTRYVYRDFACSPEKLQLYVGSYLSGEGAAVKVTAVSGGLELSVGDERLKARPVGVDTFAVELKGTEMAVRFLRDTQGEAWALALGYRIIPKAKSTEQAAT